MTLPRLGEVLELDGPEAGDTRLWSVTSIVSVVDKSDPLVAWAARETAVAAVDREDVWRSRLQHEGREAAIKYLKNARFDRGGRLSDALLGSLAHHLFNVYVVDGARPTVTPDMHPKPDQALHPDDIRDLEMMLDQFDRFLTEFQPAYSSAEVVVYSDTFGYAGQVDAFLTIDGNHVIADYKTSRNGWDWEGKPKGPYPDIAVQLAAYRHAEMAAVERARRYQPRGGRRYYLLNNAERKRAVAVPAVDGGVGIFICPHRYDVYPVRCDFSIFERFLYLIEAARWSYELSQHVVGNPMLAPHPLPVDTADPFEGLPA